MKKVIRGSITAFVTAVLICILVVYVQDEYFVPEDFGGWTIKNFYLEDKDSLDTVIIGSSEVFAGFYSGLAYQNYGITAYPFASGANTATAWKPMLTEVRKNQSPGMIVLEIDGAIFESDEMLLNESFFRRFSDFSPLSAEKISYIMESECQEDKLSYFFPFIKYHGMYENISFSHMANQYFNGLGYSRLRGISTCSCIYDGTQHAELQTDKTLPLSKKSKKYLVDFLEYCKSEKIDNIIFTRFPHAYKDSTYTETVCRKNTAKQIIESYGYEFYDFEKNYEELNIDFSRDFYNEGHLSIYGAEKFTNHLCKLLTEKYGVKGRTLTDEQKVQWEDTVSTTNRFIKMIESHIDKNETILFYEKPDLETTLSGF